MTLIYTALQSEAQFIIEKFKLKKTNSNPKIYSNKSLIVCIGGVGQVNTKSSLEYVFTSFSVSRAINIGVAGCSDALVDIGELFCTNKNLDDINFMELKTVDIPQTKEENVKLLYDMEGKYFENICNKKLDKKDIFLFKIVSDHLNDTILSKEFVKKLISNTFIKWNKYI